jgi:hypothetical protein
MLFNLDHAAVRELTPEIVNTKTGAYLHGFEWCASEDIGELPETWNWIPTASPTTEDGKNMLMLGAVHFTDGIPDRKMTFRTESVYDSMWLKEVSHYEAMFPRPYQMEPT